MSSAMRAKSSWRDLGQARTRSSAFSSKLDMTNYCIKFRTSKHPSVPEQLVDGSLRARPLVDALHDHGAVKVRARLARGQGLARHGAGDDHPKIGRAHVRTPVTPTTP